MATPYLADSPPPPHRSPVGWRTGRHQGKDRGLLLLFLWLPGSRPSHALHDVVPTGEGVFGLEDLGEVEPDTSAGYPGHWAVHLRRHRVQGTHIALGELYHDSLA